MENLEPLFPPTGMGRGQVQGLAKALGSLWVHPSPTMRDSGFLSQGLIDKRFSPLATQTHFLPPLSPRHTL